MVGEANQVLRATDEPVVDKNKSASEVESDDPVTSSSSNDTIVKMANKTTLEMSDY
jgi:hypothetical protein